MTFSEIRECFQKLENESLNDMEICRICCQILRKLIPWNFRNQIKIIIIRVIQIIFSLNSSGAPLGSLEARAVNRRAPVAAEGDGLELDEPGLRPVGDVVRTRREPALLTWTMGRVRAEG